MRGRFIVGSYGPSGECLAKSYYSEIADAREKAREVNDYYDGVQAHIFDTLTGFEVSY